MLPGRFTFDRQRTLTSVGAIRESDHPEPVEGPCPPPSYRRKPVSRNSAANHLHGARSTHHRSVHPNARKRQRKDPDITPLRRCAPSRYLHPMATADVSSIKTTATSGGPTAHTKCTRIGKDESYLKMGISDRTRLPDFLSLFPLVSGNATLRYSSIAHSLLARILPGIRRPQEASCGRRAMFSHRGWRLRIGARAFLQRCIIAQAIYPRRVCDTGANWRQDRRLRPPSR